MKIKSWIKIAVVAVLIVLVACLALNGIQIGKYIVTPVGDAISLGLDLQGGISTVYVAKDSSVENFDSLMESTISVLRTRLTNAGYTEATVARQGSDAIRVEIPDVEDPQQVVDIIGKYLTPALLVLLAALFVVGFINGGSGARYEPLDTGYDSTFAFGLVEGYQTFDLNTGTAIALIITTSFAAKGITNSKEQSKTLAWSGVIGAICCALVYLGLTLMGVLMSNDTTLLEMFESTGLDRTYLLNYVIHAYLGDLGTWLMALIVLLATFTSCLGCVGLCNQLYMRATKGKLNYKLSVIVTMIMAFVIAALGYTAAESGVEFILSLALPFISAALPVTVALTILTLFTNQIKNDNVYRAAAVMSFLCGIVSYFKIPGLYDVLSGSWNVLAPYGFDWVFPTVVAAIIGNFIKYKGFESRPYLRENAGKDQ